MDQVHAVGVIFENENGEILTLLRHKQDPEGETWGLVGGKVDSGETSRQAAVREAVEEIGHIVNPEELEFLRTYNWERSDINLCFEVFRLKTNKANVTLNLNDNENTEYKWIKPDDAYRQKNLMKGLYTILEDTYNLSS